MYRICHLLNVLLCIAWVLSHVWLFATPWTAALKASLSMGFFRQEYWSGLPLPTPEVLPNPEIEPPSLATPALGGRFFTTCHLGTHVYLWQIHFDIWQNQYNIVKLKNKIKKIYRKKSWSEQCKGQIVEFPYQAPSSSFQGSLADQLLELSA